MRIREERKAVEKKGDMAAAVVGGDQGNLEEYLG